MASVEDYPFADFKFGSFDNNMPANNGLPPANTDLLPMGILDGMDQMSTNMAYLEEEHDPLSTQMLVNQYTMNNPFFAPMETQTPVHQQQHHHIPQHHQEQQQQQQQFPMYTQQPAQQLTPVQHVQPVQPQQMQLFQQMEHEFMFQQQPQPQYQHQQSPPKGQFYPQAQFDGFPPVHAFVPPVSTPVTRTNMEFHTPQRSRFMSEPDIMETLESFKETPLSLSPESVIASSIAQSFSTAPSSTHEYNNNFSRYKVIRGISSGGSATKPPRVLTLENHHYDPVNLELIGATLNDLCHPQWSEEEKMDRRRIIRVERWQVGSRIIAQFSIVGAAKDHPKTEPAAFGVDVVEVSCLECYTPVVDDDEESEESEESEYPVKAEDEEMKRSFFITSVEVIKVVELLIGTELQDAVERRRERGRIRSNLVPFWSKRPISSRMSNQESRNSPMGSDASDFRVELATRIMSYETRKPRGFDKEVRILRWERLVPALKRALQSYYVEVPDNFEEDEDDE